MVSPARAPTEMMFANPGLPTERKASASGAAMLIWLYLTIPVTTIDTAT